MSNTVVMRLDRGPFDRLKDGKKLWEIRLNDDKRKGIVVGDEIVFMRRPELEERLPMIVEEKKWFADLQQMLDKVPASELIPEEMSEVKWIQDFMAHYRPEEVVKCGIIAFKVKKA